MVLIPNEFILLGIFLYFCAMANNPIDTDAFKHELQFADFNSNWYEICEPIGFDGAEFIIEQNSGRYSRDVVKFAVDKLKFVDATGGLATTTQQINPQGDYSEFRDYGLQWLLYAIKLKGFEAKVYYKLSANGTTLRIFQFDFTSEPLTDGKTYVECMLIDNGTVMSVKRTLESKFNAFSNKDWGGNTITPINTFNYLKRATSINAKSQLTQSENFNRNVTQFGGDAHVFQPCLNIQNSEIENTLTSFLEIEYQPDTGDLPFSQQLIQDRTVIKAKKRITNLKIKLSGLTGSFITSGFFTRNQLSVAYGNVAIDDWTVIDLFNSTNVNYIFSNQSYEVTIPFLEVGQRVWIYFSCTNGNPIQGSTPLSNISLNIANTFKIDFEANTKAFDQVMKAFRWVDLLKQASKFKGNLPVNAQLFENGGTHYNNAVFNKRMMTSRTDYFYITPKDCFESVQEVNCDYEINEDSIFIDHQAGFYKNIEIGSFVEIPSSDYSEPENKRAQVNKGVYEYVIYEQDRTTTGTSSGVHTNAELRYLNESVENSFDRKIKFSRDPLASQKAIDLEITTPTTATEDDNNVYIERFVSLAPNSFGEIPAFLAMRLIDGRLEILNIDSDGDVSNFSFTWTNKGISVGNIVQITAGQNVGFYTVFAIEPNKITLTPNAGTVISFSGDGFINLKYYYTNVQYQTQTNQGFSLIENISNTFSNLFYTIKRNLQNYFSEHLAMIMYYAQKDIVVAKPPINENCTTQLTTETEPVIENAPITFDSLPNPLITPKMYNGVMVADYNDVVNYLNAYKDNRGFIRVVTTDNEVKRIFSQEFKYSISTRQLEVKGEVQFETVNLTLTGTKSELFVNGAPYNFNDNFSWWKLSNEYLSLYDENSRPITNEYHFNLVILNGVTFETREELESALVNLT